MKKIIKSFLFIFCMLVCTFSFTGCYFDFLKINQNNNSNNNSTTYYFSNVLTNDEETNEYEDYYNFSFYGMSIKVENNKMTLYDSNEEQEFTLTKDNDKYTLTTEDEDFNEMYKNSYLEISNETALMTLSDDNYSMTIKFIKDKSKIKVYDYKWNSSSNSLTTKLPDELSSSFINIKDDKLTLYLNENSYFIFSMTEEDSKYKLTYLSNSPLAERITNGSNLIDVFNKVNLVILENELQIMYEESGSHTIHKLNLSYKKIQF